MIDIPEIRKEQLEAQDAGLSLADYREWKADNYPSEEFCEDPTEKPDKPIKAKEISKDG